MLPTWSDRQRQAIGVKSTPSKEELNRLWADPANWTPLGFYRCKDDPRTWVLKRGNGVGYTINVAHERSSLVFLAVVLISVAPTIAGVVMGAASPRWFLLVQLLVPIAIVVGLLVWLSGRDRS